MKYKKIGTSLLSAFEDLSQDGPTALLSHTRTLGMAPVMGTQKPPRVIVFIHCDENANLDDLIQAGIQMNQSKGHIRTALLPLDKLEVLADHGKVKRILGSRRLRPRLDVAAEKVKLPKFRNKSKLSGKGTIIGIIDSGIDPRHPDFAGRILSLWDQTLDGPGVDEGAYGMELTGTLLAASRDRNGHGTHVSGIATGAGAKYQGVAPGADLIVVKTTFQDAHIADGIRYVFRMAESLKRPAVVNLSLGGHSDPHDGTDSLCQVIDDESGPGRIVCCAAGNEGDVSIHAGVKLGKPTTKTMRFQVGGDNIRTAELNGWYPGSGKLEISIVSPDGFSTPFQPVITVGNFLKRYSLPTARVTVETPDKDPTNGDHHFTVQITGVHRNDPAPQGRWQLRVKNESAVSGALDVWLLDDQESPQVVWTDNNASESLRIGSPGAATRAVTVAAYVTRNAWVDADKNKQEVGMDIDTIAEFSSDGPLRTNPKSKPDVTAPGAMIVSCLSADSDPQAEDIVVPIQPGPGYVVEAGTSMATPFVSGLVALLLERTPDLDPEAVKETLKKACRIPGKTIGTFDPKWGFGLVDAGKL